jgi:hypothetical protein
MDNGGIAIIAIIMVFMVPILAIGLGMLTIYLNYRKRKEMFALYHQERMAAIEKGIELSPMPQDFFLENSDPPRRRLSHGTLLGGLVLLFLGLTLYVALHVTVPRMDAGGDVALFALIPAGIGVACLIYYFTVGRKLAAAMEEEWKARLAEAARVRNQPA